MEAGLVPAAFSSWDPLLQRFTSAPPPARFAPAATPAAAAAPPLQTPSSGIGRLQLGTPGGGGGGGGLFATPANAAPATPAELESQSIALAMRLQQEEHNAFRDAMDAATPAGRTPAGAATPMGGATPGAQSMETDAEDESLRLAMQLQQEELQWQHMQAQHAAGMADGEIDEDVALAMRLQQEEDGL